MWRFAFSNIHVRCARPQRSFNSPKPEDFNEKGLRVGIVPNRGDWQRELRLRKVSRSLRSMAELAILADVTGNLA